ncbi:Hsp20/alpha crystallin family protein [Ornithinicoccus hortensis]|uniref:HSP20 family protein n=1 Tax=Ornithinicoccus hortensis TaxID=82346 RepID=A0A542YMJ3_9MICO|nr:Hsp20/alpha crystallin family protein [Ornithinicoccus hortensis]TQL49308.1 HSP20 family protein [Ornithinicoccus hortensis]
MVLLRSNPVRYVDPAAETRRRTDGPSERARVIPMDAWREDDAFVIEFELPGLDAEAIGLDAERGVVTITAERPDLTDDIEPIVAERPRGTFRRHLVLGENLDVDDCVAKYDAGVLTLRVPLARETRSHKIPISSPEEPRPDAASTERGGGS